MRPPICALCNDRFDPKDGGTVRFANFEPLPEGMVGHPKGLEWFCGQHIESAKGRSHMTTKEAIDEMWVEASSSGC
ncbi:MAG: hypothetical protein AB8G95_17915 [Anaerolineae bacterium]